MRFLLLTIMLMLSLGSFVSNANATGMTVDDSIAMVRFSDPFTRLTDAECKFSPDGRNFLVVTTRGILSTNKLESALWLYSADDVSRYLHTKNGQPPKPRMLFKVDGTLKVDQPNSYGSLITSIQWSNNANSILALVEKANGYRHVFRIALSDGHAADLTPGSIDVRSFDEESGTIAYLVTKHVAPKEIFGRPINAASSDMTGLSLYHIFFPATYPDPTSFWPPIDIWARYKGVNHQLNPNGVWYYPTSAAQFRPTLSPDGRLLVAARPVPSISSHWSRYAKADATSSFSVSATGTDRSGKNFSWPWQYIIIDLNTMEITPIVDAPTGFLEGYYDIPQAVWSSDGMAVLFTNSYLPLPKVSTVSGSTALLPCAAAMYRLATRSVSCIAHAQDASGKILRSVAFGKSSHIAVLHWEVDGVSRTETYRETQHGWQTEPGGEPSDVLRPNLRAYIRQDINVPPTLWASEPKSGLKKLLWNPNPQLQALDLGQASVYTWKDNTGYKWHAGLVKPLGYVPGRRYPLVIQTHGFYNRHEFLVDGSFTTAFAARPLAAAGFVVLQMEDRADRHAKPPQQEALLAVEGFKSAIDHLNSDGLIDPSKVGIIGFSRTAWDVEEALIHAPSRFRAASLTDGIDQSYLAYILFSPDWPEGMREPEEANGARPFGAGLLSWIKNAANFNLNKVQAPIAVTAIGGLDSILGEWEIYSSLYLQKKPVDFIYIPNGQHILQNPQERYASQQGSVDWFRFWLQGYERPDPKMAAQYHLWENLCDMQVTEHPDLPAFCVRTKH